MNGPSKPSPPHEPSGSARSERLRAYKQAQRERFVEREGAAALAARRKMEKRRERGRYLLPFVILDEAGNQMRPHDGSFQRRQHLPHPIADGYFVLPDPTHVREAIGMAAIRAPLSRFTEAQLQGYALLCWLMGWDIACLQAKTGATTLSRKHGRWLVDTLKHTVRLVRSEPRASLDHFSRLVFWPTRVQDGPQELVNRTEAVAVCAAAVNAHLRDSNRKTARMTLDDARSGRGEPAFVLAMNLALFGADRDACEREMKIFHRLQAQYGEVFQQLSMVVDLHGGKDPCDGWDMTRRPETVSLDMFVAWATAWNTSRCASVIRKAVLCESDSTIHVNGTKDADDPVA